MVVKQMAEQLLAKRCNPDSNIVIGNLFAVRLIEMTN